MLLLWHIQQSTLIECGLTIVYLCRVAWRDRAGDAGDAGDQGIRAEPLFVFQVGPRTLDLASLPALPDFLVAPGPLHAVTDYVHMFIS